MSQITLLEDASKKCYRTWDVIQDGKRIGTIQENVPSMGLTGGRDDGRRLVWGRDINFCRGLFDSTDEAVAEIRRLAAQS